MTAVTRAAKFHHYLIGMRLLHAFVLAVAVLSCLALTALIAAPGLFGLSGA